jgi:hypothetical protein
MRIYVVIGLFADNSENVYVGTDLFKVLSFQPSDFDCCDSLLIEVWENGEKIGYLNKYGEILKDC